MQMDGGIRVAVPAHITGFFSVHRADDPLETGSRGAGVTLADAIHVDIEPADESTIVLDGREVDIPAVDHVLDRFSIEAAVRASLTVPVGAGFGVSGAVALGTAFGVNQLARGRYSENEVVAIAHVADVTAGTGLGDVVAQHRGGIPIRIEPGGPGYGTLDGIPERRQVEWLCIGELSTEEIISGETEIINSVGARALAGLREEPTLKRFMHESVKFAREAGLVTEALETIIRDVEDAGGSASMAMLGETVFAVGDGLSSAGYDVTTHDMATGGVRIIDPSRAD